jgi:hypothetical protein
MRTPTEARQILAAQLFSAFDAEPTENAADRSDVRDTFANALDLFEAAVRDETIAEQALFTAAQVRQEREAFLSSDRLDPSWVAGWHASNDHVANRFEAVR